MTPIDTTIAIASLGIVLAVLKVLEHVVLNYLQKNRNGQNGIGKNATIINCPNHLPMLGETIRKIDSNVKTAAADAVQVRQGVHTLVEQHKSEGGRELWKIPHEYLEVWDGIGKRQEQLVQSMEKMVEAVHETLDVIRSQSASTLEIAQYLADKQE